ncbi:MAG: translation initiation factor [Candidatus Doudnabacteria bacterium]|nr:translation initiation factor [Candidatus Doudnabacteria bacterium]
MVQFRQLEFKVKTISTSTHDFGKSDKSKEVIELDGKVLENLPNALFRIQIDSGQIILAHIAGKLRVNKIRVLPGDKVIVEVTPYDLTRGRIVRRLR